MTLSHRLRPLLPLLLLATAVPAGTLAAQAACAPGRLLLEEVGAFALPASFGIEGWATGPGGRVVLQGADGELFLLDSARTLTRIPLADTLHPAGLALPDDGGLRFVARASGREYRVGAGVVATGARVALAPGDVLEQATWVGGRWYLAVREGPAGRLVVRDAAGRVLLDAPRGPEAASLRRLHLAPAGGALLVGGLTAPFTPVRIDPASGRVDSLTPPLSALGAPDIAPDSLATWRALPAIALDCATLLTLADLTGDRRLLVRYGPGAGVVRVAPLSAPLGLMAAAPDRPLLLAARRAGELELVWYHWRWVADPAPSP